MGRRLGRLCYFSKVKMHKNTTYFLKIEAGVYWLRTRALDFIAGGGWLNASKIRACYSTTTSMAKCISNMRPLNIIICSFLGMHVCIMAMCLRPQHLMAASNKWACICKGLPPQRVVCTHLWQQQQGGNDVLTSHKSKQGHGHQLKSKHATIS